MFKIFAPFVVMTVGYLAIMHLVVSGMPLDDSLAYQALVGQLHRQDGLSARPLELSTATIIHRDGEAILYGGGSLRRSYLDHGTRPVSEAIEFSYLAVISRKCNERTAACYKADDIEVTGRKRVAPLI